MDLQCSPTPTKADIVQALNMPLELRKTSRARKKPTRDGHGKENDVVLRPDVMQHQIVYGGNN